MVVRQYRFQDPYNTCGERNWNNCNKSEVNCAGYALGIFSWWQPTEYIDLSWLYSGVKLPEGASRALKDS